MPFPLPPDLHWETKVCARERDPFLCTQKALLFPLGIQRARIALAPFFRYTTTTELLQCLLLFSREKKEGKGVNTYTRRRRKREGH